MRVEVTWIEEWQRKAIVTLNDADLRDWAGAWPVSFSDIAHYLDSSVDSRGEWHPNTAPTHEADEFLDLTINSARPALIGTKLVDGVLQRAVENLE